MSWTQTPQHFLPSQSSVRIISSRLQNLPQSVPDLSSLTANTCNTGEFHESFYGKPVWSLRLFIDSWPLGGHGWECASHLLTHQSRCGTSKYREAHCWPCPPGTQESLNDLYNNDLMKPLLLGAFAHPQMTEHLHCAWWSLFLFMKSCSSFA